MLDDILVLRKHFASIRKEDGLSGTQLFILQHAVVLTKHSLCYSCIELAAGQHLLHLKVPKAMAPCSTLFSLSVLGCMAASCKAKLAVHFPCFMIPCPCS